MGNLIHGVLVLLVASIIGGGSYALCRKIEKAWHFFYHFVVGLLFVLIAAGVLATLSVLPALIVSFYLLIIIVPSLFGAWFHLRSGGSSRDEFCALFTVATSVSLSLFWGNVLEPLFRPGPFGRIEDSPAPLYYLSLWVSPVLAPFALWIWQSLRIRPSVDEPMIEQPRSEPPSQ